MLPRFARPKASAMKHNNAILDIIGLQRYSNYSLNQILLPLLSAIFLCLLLACTGLWLQQPFQLGHAFCGFLGDYGYALAFDFCRRGVDVVDGRILAGVVEKPGGGIHVERRADHHQYVGLFHDVNRRFDVGHRLLEEYDVGALVGAVFVERLRGGRKVVGRERVHAFLVFHRTHFHQLAVQVKHVAASGALVQVVDVLGDDAHVEIFFKVFQSDVSGIGLAF